MVSRISSSAAADSELHDNVDIQQLTWIITSTFMGTKETLGLSGELAALPKRIEGIMNSLLTQYFV